MRWSCFNGCHIHSIILGPWFRFIEPYVCIKIWIFLHQRKHQIPNLLGRCHTHPKVCREGIVDLEGVCFTNVLHVPLLLTNLLSIYQITHSGSGRKVEFTPDSIVITEISTSSQLAHGIADQGSRLYFFSHFVPKYIIIVFLSQSNDIIRLWHEIFGHLNYNYLHQISKENMVEGFPSIKFTSGVC